MDAFFFPTSDASRLFGVARGPRDAARVWILCPPFGEEEKSSRRLWTLIAQNLEARGEASLVFSFRGTGDSEGDFEAATLSQWRLDIAAASAQAKLLFPRATIALLGARLGAALAWQEAQQLGAARLLLIEPLLSGRSFLMQQNAKKQLRARLTDGSNTRSESETKTAAETAPQTEDLDGWALGQTLKTEMSALDLKRETPNFSGSTTIVQIGPKSEVAPPLQALSDERGARARAVVMPAFWNLVDAPDFSPLLRVIEDEIDAR